MTDWAIPSCLIVVPMKDPSASKSRLLGVLSQSQRRSLARLMFRRTLTVLHEVQRLLITADVALAVVTNSTEVETLASQMDVRVIPEGMEHSLSGAANTAAAWAEGRDFASVCIIPADLAAPDSEAIAAFVSRGLKTGRPVVCPSTDLGTNAIMISPPGLIEFQYGPNSSVTHLKLLEESGAVPVQLSIESIQFDIDTSACLQRAIDADDGLDAKLKAME